MSGIEFIPLAVELALKAEDVLGRFIRCTQDSIHFGIKVEVLRLRLELERSNFASIKRILLGNIAGQTNQGLFSELPRNQKIDVLNVLRLFSDTLLSRLTIVEEELNVSRPSLENVSDASVMFGSYHSAKFTTRLKFGFRLNSKLGKSAKELKEWNESLRAIILLHITEKSLLLSPATELREGSTASYIPPSLKQCQDDLTNLELTNDLALANLVAQGTNQTRIPSLDLQCKSVGKYPLTRIDGVPSTASRYISSQDNAYFLIETRSFTSTVVGGPSDRSVARVQQLSNILHEASLSRYHIVRCKEFLIEDNHFKLVFSLPPRAKPQFKSLLTMIHETQKLKPSLDERYILAREIATTVLNFHTVGWVHKSIRSDNILFFNFEDGNGKFEIAKPHLAGWDYARPESGVSSQLYLPDEICENIYRHPEQWGLPTVKFNRVHDLYALGIVLYEIGCWRGAQTILPRAHEDWTPRQYKDFYLFNVKHQRFSGNVSKRYQRLVVDCLLGKKGEPSEVMSDEDVSTESPTTITDFAAFSRYVSALVAIFDSLVLIGFVKIISNLDDIVNSL